MPRGFISRTKSASGTLTMPIPTIASATNMAIPDGTDLFYVSGTTAVATLVTAKVPGRRLTIIGITTTGPAFTNNNDTTTEGQMDLGGSNRTIAPNDVLQLIQKDDGSWLMTNLTDN